jgi:hypothetical protein
MQAWAERPRLDSDFIAQCHYPSLWHFSAEPAAFDQGDLITANDNYRSIQQNCRRDQQSKIPPMPDYEFKNHTSPLIMLHLQYQNLLPANDAASNQKRPFERNLYRANSR